MKQIIGLICLALFCVGVARVEYETMLRFDNVVILFADASFFLPR